MCDFEIDPQQNQIQFVSRIIINDNTHNSTSTYQQQ